MEETVLLILPALIAIVLIRIFLVPIRLSCKLAFHSAGGFLCLWLLNAVTPFTGVALPVNPATVLIAGFLGLPGIWAIAILTVL